MNSVNTEALDPYDSRILAELQRDARISMSELGRRVHLSQPAVTERVRKLELSGVIRGYHAVVDAARLGYGIRAIVRVGRCDYASVIKRIEETPEVINAYNLTGEESWMLEIAVQDVPHLDEVLAKFCLLTETSTSIILSVAREHHPLLPRCKAALSQHLRNMQHAILHLIRLVNLREKCLLGRSTCSSSYAIDSTIFYLNFKKG